MILIWLIKKTGRFVYQRHCSCFDVNEMYNRGTKQAKSRQPKKKKNKGRFFFCFFLQSNRLLFFCVIFSSSFAFDLGQCGSWCHEAKPWPYWGCRSSPTPPWWQINVCHCQKDCHVSQHCLKSLEENLGDRQLPQETWKRLSDVVKPFCITGRRKSIITARAQQNWHPECPWHECLIPNYWKQTIWGWFKVHSGRVPAISMH